MKLTLTYHYDPGVNNHMVCVVYNEEGKKIASGYHSRDFTEAKWAALREAQRIFSIKPIIVPKTEYVDVSWGV